MVVNVRRQPRAITRREARVASNQGAPVIITTATASASIRRSLAKDTLSVTQNPRTRASTKLSILPVSAVSLAQGPAMDSASSQAARLSPPNKLPPRSRKKDRSDAFRECIICAEAKPLGHNGSNFPTFPRCLHGPFTCSNCVSKHIVTSLKTRAPINHNNTTDKGIIDWSICTCPHCNIPLTESEIRSALNRVENAVITGIVGRKELESHPRWTWCLSVTCSSGRIFPEGSRSPKVVCVKCGASSCFLHGIPWHHEYSCGEYDDNHPNAQSVRSSEDRIKRLTKKCPNPQCGWRIQMSGGCPRIRCIKCHEQFYWGEVKWDDNITPEPEEECELIPLF